jgi:translation initiation factor 1
VRREKRRGKWVTVIAGLDPGSDLKGLAKELRAMLGAGGTVAEGEVEIQGDHKERIVELLKSRGYPAKGAGG